MHHYHIAGSCKCNAGFIGLDCSGSKNTTPTIDPVVYCSGKNGCKTVVISGTGFASSQDLKCRFTTILVSFIRAPLLSNIAGICLTKPGQENRFT